ncbi:MAG: ATP-binding protein [candidate division KSB1 bacterium]|nr:ATP-binding protein [candidate division KSB1 bacterium]MDZ7306197.1 ATP-binding protein [candidate division KSB1 bacterium]MDZ7352146.1 ATP-binding protein [candidate division KSB1 bacterium]MDZ7394302.1 ATP-binding protein [candidate division KSB1 bacterium]
MSRQNARLQLAAFHKTPPADEIMWQYRLYGLRLLANRQLPGLPVAAHAEANDVRVWFGEMPPWLPANTDRRERLCRESRERDDQGAPVQRLWQAAGGNYYRFVFSDGVEFVVDCSGREIGVTWAATSSPEDAATYLLGPILAVALGLQEVTCLHASAVAIAGGAVALVGPSGAGKSTTAASFARLGFPVLSDDVLALRDRRSVFLAQPGYPSLRLWSDAVTALFGSAEALPPLTPTWDKRCLDLCASEYKFQQDELPLRAIYFLDDRGQSPQSLIMPVPPAEGLLLLLANSYLTHDLDRRHRLREFDLLSRVARHVPLRRVQAPENPAHLPALCAAITAEVQTGSASES